MSIQEWSDNIVVAELQDDPAFSDDLTALSDLVREHPDVSVVLNLAGIEHLNSSNIAKLLKLRKALINNQRKLRLCGLNTHVWGLFLVTGLDKVFEFADNVAMGLAGVQIDQR
ncbi:MAG TPA: STAS domain-containing protein [Phycisphaerae bacterium]|jgi:anti-anti-sigma factor